MIVTCATIAFVVKPLLLVKVVGYNYREIWKVIGNCGLVVAIATPLPIVFRLVTSDNWTNYIITGVLCIISTAASVWGLGLDVSMKKKVATTIKAKLVRA